MNRPEGARLAWSSPVLLLPTALQNAHSADGVGSTGGTVVGLVQVVFALAVVLAAIVLFGWLLRRWMPASIGPSGVLRVIGGVMVGPKERLVLVELGDTWLLLGVAAGSVNLLHHMPRPEGALPPVGAPGASAFARRLMRAMSRGRKES
ncbi:MAG TPA: flagellar biosynthetic protein FliO [Burkholderiales bacterium]|nr:flagellar biosynthetic protein FliO [Burkholderiales bacterium]